MNIILNYIIYPIKVILLSGNSLFNVKLIDNGIIKYYKIIFYYIIFFSSKLY